MKIFIPTYYYHYILAIYNKSRTFIISYIILINIKIVHIFKTNLIVSQTINNYSRKIILVF